MNFDAEGDAYFDDVDWAQWRLESEESFLAQDDKTPGYTVMVWHRAR